MGEGSCIVFSPSGRCKLANVLARSLCCKLHGGVGANKLDIGAGSVLFVCALHLLFTSPSTIFPPIIPADQALSEGQSRALVYAFSGFPQKGDLTFTALPVDGGNLDFSSHRRRVGSLVKSFRSLNWRLYAALLVKQAMPTVSGRRLEVMLMF